MSTFLAILGALPAILRLVQSFLKLVDAKQAKGIGRQEAIAEALAAAQKDLAVAKAAELMAQELHAKRGDDSAFDQDFRRGL